MELLLSTPICIQVSAEIVLILKQPFVSSAQIIDLTIKNPNRLNNRLNIEKAYYC